MNPYTCTKSPKNYECNEHGRLHLGTLLHWIQEVADTHAENLGFGHSKCFQTGLGWVQISIHIELTRLPILGELVTLETWTFPSSGLIAGRNCLIKDTKGETLICATTQWVLISMEKRRPIPLKRFITLPEFYTTQNDSFFPDSIEKLTLRHDLTPIRDFLADRHYIDINHHVNNATYTTWVYDSLDSDWLANHKLNFLKIYYLKESHLHDTLTLSSSECSDKTEETHHIFSVDNEERVKIILNWQKSSTT